METDIYGNMSNEELALLNLTGLYLSEYTYHEEDDQRRSLITYYLMGIGSMSMCCLGLVGNMLSLVVLTHRHMRSSTYSYLTALAVCDSLVLLLTIVLLVHDLDKPEPGQQRWPWDKGIYPYLFPWVHPAAFGCQVLSIWLTLAFTVDRYLMICHPFCAEPYCTISRARKVILALAIGAFLLNIPKFFEYETNMISMPPDNQTRATYDLTLFGRSNLFRELYHSWFYIVFVCGVPFLALAILNGFLIHAVRLSRQRGREINAAERKRNDTTVMLISVVVVFFICQMPALVSRTIWAFEKNPRVLFERLQFYLLNEIGNFLIILNSAINIMPYYFFGQRFRKQFWRLFCQCLMGYKRFQKATRSFSLTLLQERRMSNGSTRHGSRDRSAITCRASVGSAQNIKMNLLSAPRRDSRTSSRKSSGDIQESGENPDVAEQGLTCLEKTVPDSDINGVTSVKVMEVHEVLLEEHKEDDDSR